MEKEAGEQEEWVMMVTVLLFVLYSPHLLLLLLLVLVTNSRGTTNTYCQYCYLLDLLFFQYLACWPDSKENLAVLVLGLVVLSVFILFCILLYAFRFLIKLLWGDRREKKDHRRECMNEECWGGMLLKSWNDVWIRVIVSSLYMCKEEWELLMIMQRGKHSSLLKR